MEPSTYVGFPYSGWWKEREEMKGGKCIHSSTPAQKLLNGILVEREKKRKGEKLCFQREKSKNFLDLFSILLETFESLNTGSSDLFLSDILEQASSRVICPLSHQFS
jgi:hypothetical protein